MAQTQDTPPVITFGTPSCDCPESRADDFVPRMSALSNDELDICEIMALSLIAGAPSLSWDTMKYAFSMTKCYRCMSDRQRREEEIWRVFYLAGGCVTNAEAMSAIETILSKTTRQERLAALTGLRSYVWDYANCSDL